MLQTKVLMMRTNSKKWKKSECRRSQFHRVFLNGIDYLRGITIVFNIATASPALVIVEVRGGKGDTWEVLLVGAEPAATRRVSPLSATWSAHVVDDSVHVDVDLGLDSQWQVQHFNKSFLFILSFILFLCKFTSFSSHRNMSKKHCLLMITKSNMSLHKAAA